MTSSVTMERAFVYGPHVICTRCDIRIDGRPLRDDAGDVRGVEYLCKCGARALYGLRPDRSQSLSINNGRRKRAA
jgi:hypothetical protein